MNLRARIARALPNLVFFLALLVWIAAKVSYSFGDEFPSLGLLCRWDCGWYESIARQGYVSPIPPLFQNSEHSNVAFFPAYPFLGRAVAIALGIPFTSALPLVSIVCALIVSLAIARHFRGLGRLSRTIRYAILVAYPATFYLFVSYSESLYLAGMLGGAALLLDFAERESERTESPPASARRDSVRLALVGLAGLTLGGTRLTGFVIPSFLALGALLLAGRNFLRDRFFLRTLVFIGAAAAGIVSFFAFCQIRFGKWNLYFTQLAIGWYKEFSPRKALGILVNHPFGPTFDYRTLQEQSRCLSWMLITTILLVSLYAMARAAGSLLRALRDGNRALVLRCMLVYGAFAHFFIVVCGDVGPWDIWGNGLRYPMPTVFLLAIAWRDEWTPARLRENPALRGAALLAIALVCAWLFALQWGYLERFIRLEWVS